MLIADESLALARLAADRIVLVDAGRVVLDAPREEALADERLGRRLHHGFVVDSVNVSVLL